MENDLISRAALLEKLDVLSELFRRRGETEDKGFLAVQCGVTFAQAEIEDAPSIDAEPVVHARWVLRPYSDDGDPSWGGEIVCSNCGERAPIHYDEDQYETAYCKDCGSKMDAPERAGKERE